MKKDDALFRAVVIALFLVLLPIMIIFSGLRYSETPTTSNLPEYASPWPPVVGLEYPDLELIDQDGEFFKLSYLKGKVIVVEPIGMNCPACQGYSGANELGPFGNNEVQPHALSFQTLFPRYAQGLELPHRDVVFVQLLLYDLNLEAPTPADARKWAKHFQLHRKHNHFVAVPPADLRGKASFGMIPGFQLIGRDFVLRSDSTGHRPKDGLYRDLIPMIPRLLKEKP